jgi:hypothetical protein
MECKEFLGRFFLHNSVLQAINNHRRIPKDFEFFKIPMIILNKEALCSATPQENTIFIRID